MSYACSRNHVLRRVAGQRLSSVIPTMPKAAQARIRPRFGDIIEINTAKGFAYALYTHKHTDPPRWGSVLRIIPGVFLTRPEAFQRLIELEPQFITFFPLGAACNRHIVRIVDSVMFQKTQRHFRRFAVACCRVEVKTCSLIIFGMEVAVGNRVDCLPDKRICQLNRSSTMQC